MRWPVVRVNVGHSVASCSHPGQSRAGGGAGHDQRGGSVQEQGCTQEPAYRIALFGHWFLGALRACSSLVAHVGCAARGWSQEYVSCERDVLKRSAALLVACTSAQPLFLDAVVCAYVCRCVSAGRSSADTRSRNLRKNWGGRVGGTGKGPSERGGSRWRPQSLAQVLA